MKKVADWEIEFDAFLSRKLKTPFAWGEWDCVMFTNGFIKAMTKEDLLPKQWKWKTEKEAMQCILKYGKGKGLAHAIQNAVNKTKGIKEIDKSYVTKGDFGVYREESELACVFDGYHALGVNDDGVVVKNNVDIVKAWRISV
jgi:hypothetical protein